MVYNWERAPYPWEQHRKAFVVAFSVMVIAAFFVWLALS